MKKTLRDALSSAEPNAESWARDEAALADALGGSRRRVSRWVLAAVAAGALAGVVVWSTRSEEPVPEVLSLQLGSDIDGPMEISLTVTGGH